MVREGVDTSVPFGMIVPLDKVKSLSAFRGNESTHNPAISRSFTREKTVLTDCETEMTSCLLDKAVDFDHPRQRLLAPAVFRRDVVGFLSQLGLVLRGCGCVIQNVQEGLAASLFRMPMPSPTSKFTYRG